MVLVWPESPREAAAGGAWGTQQRLGGGEWDLRVTVPAASWLGGYHHF